MTTINELKPHQRQAAQKVADIAGTHISNVDLTQFADMEAPPDNSSIGIWARSNQAYVEAAAKNRAEAELAELREVAAAALPSAAEIAEMALSFGISGELLLVQFAEKKALAQETLGARQKTIDATRKQAEQAAQEAKLSEAISSRDHYTLIQFGKDPSHPLAAPARAAMSVSWPGWKWDN